MKSELTAPADHAGLVPFNGMLPDPGTLTATALLFMASAGFSIASPQIKRLIREIHADAAILKKIKSINQRLSIDEFIELARNLLSAEQKLFLLLTLYDSVDAGANKSSVAFFEKLSTAFEASVENLDTYLSVIDVKHSLWRQ